MVIPFRYAVFLKQQGVRQHSLYYWVQSENGTKLTHHPHARDLVVGKTIPDETLPDNFYSAFLTDELSIILEDDKPYNLYAVQMRFQYLDSFCNKEFMEVYSFGSVLVEAFMRYEEEMKELRNRQPKQPPKSPKNPNTNGDFK